MGQTTLGWARQAPMAWVGLGPAWANNLKIGPGLDIAQPGPNGPMDTPIYVV